MRSGRILHARSDNSRTRSGAGVVSVVDDFSLLDFEDAGDIDELDAELESESELEADDGGRGDFQFEAAESGFLVNALAFESTSESV